MFKPLCTAKVWKPWYVDSEITSLNQNDIEAINAINARFKKLCDTSKPCIVKTTDVVSVKRENVVKIGRGEGDTKWNEGG